MDECEVFEGRNLLLHLCKCLFLKWFFLIFTIDISNASHANCKSSPCHFKAKTASSAKRRKMSKIEETIEDVVEGVTGIQGLPSLFSHRLVNVRIIIFLYYLLDGVFSDPKKLVKWSPIQRVFLIMEILIVFEWGSLKENLKRIEFSFESFPAPAPEIRKKRRAKGAEMPVDLEVFSQFIHSVNILSHYFFYINNKAVFLHPQEKFKNQKNTNQGKTAEFEKEQHCDQNL